MQSHEMFCTHVFFFFFLVQLFLVGTQWDLTYTPEVFNALEKKADNSWLVESGHTARPNIIITLHAKLCSGQHLFLRSIIFVS